MSKLHFTVLGTCFLCAGIGVLEALMGHIHHAWPWFMAAGPGGAALRLSLLDAR